MTTLQPLMDFFSAIENDPRIGLSHISLYCALLKSYSNKEPSQSMPIEGAQLMKTAKISGLGTYHRCIRDLHEFGYIDYKPSHNHRKKSKVNLVISNK